MSNEFVFIDSGNDQDVFLEKLALKKSDLPKDLKKYWEDRYSLFTRFDEGIYLTPELWYSVTPEPVAIFYAKFFKHCLPELQNVLDLFCGGGGNTIQFARFFKEVYALDYNTDNIKCTLHNAALYGVDQKVHPIEFDWGKVQSSKGSRLLLYLNERVDVVFASPPWGGPSYTSQKVYNLDDLMPLNIEDLLRTCFEISNNVCLFLPRTSDLKQLSEVTRKLGKPKCKVLYTYHTGRLKGMSVFWGDNFTY